MSAAALHALASEYLAACAAALASTAAGAPVRSYVSPGPPAWDCCPQLTVYVGGPVVAETQTTRTLGVGHRSTTTGLVNLVSLTATILRCAPTIDGNKLPAPDALDAAAAEMNADLWAIWNWLTSRKRDATLFAPREREMIVDDAAALTAQGACCGWQLPIRVQLDGYRG